MAQVRLQLRSCSSLGLQFMLVSFMNNLGTCLPSFVCEGLRQSQQQTMYWYSSMSMQSNPCIGGRSQWSTELARGATLLGKDYPNAMGV